MCEPKSLKPFPSTIDCVHTRMAAPRSHPHQRQFLSPKSVPSVTTIAAASPSAPGSNAFMLTKNESVMRMPHPSVIRTQTPHASNPQHTTWTPPGAPQPAGDRSSFKPVR